MKVKQEQAKVLQGGRRVGKIEADAEIAEIVANDGDWRRQMMKGATTRLSSYASELRDQPNRNRVVDKRREVVRPQFRIWPVNDGSRQQRCV